jgi:hypothetical protein
MYSRFLREAAQITGNGGLDESAAAFQHIAERWDGLAAWFKNAYEAQDPVALLPETTEPLNELADLEEGAWTELRRAVA